MLTGKVVSAPPHLKYDADKWLECFPKKINEILFMMAMDRDQRTYNITDTKDPKKGQSPILVRLHYAKSVGIIK